MATTNSQYLPWTKALHAAGVPETIKNGHGYWGFSKGIGGRVVCSVWSDNIIGGMAKAFIPKVDKGGYREAARSLRQGDEVIVLLRSRITNEGMRMPTLWQVAEIDLTAVTTNSIGVLLLRNSSNLL